MSDLTHTPEREVGPHVQRRLFFSRTSCYRRHGSRKSHGATLMPDLVSPPVYASLSFRSHDDTPLIYTSREGRIGASLIGRCAIAPKSTPSPRSTLVFLVCLVCLFPFPVAPFKNPPQYLGLACFSLAAGRFPGYSCLSTGHCRCKQDPAAINPHDLS